MRTPANRFAQSAKIPRFTPARARRRRAKGWTPANQRRFITSPYNLRRRPGAESFARAWDAARADASRRALDFAIDAALAPIARPQHDRCHFTGPIARDDDRRALLVALRVLTAFAPHR